MDPHIASNWGLEDAVKEADLNAYPTKILFFDDFEGPTIENWDSSVGTDTQPAATGRTVVQMATASGIGQLAQLVGDVNAAKLPFLASNVPLVKFAAALQDADPANYNFKGGLSSVVPVTAEALPNDFIGFMADDGESATNFLAHCIKDGTETVVDTGIAIDTAFHDFEFEVISTSEVVFKIDGAIVATITTNIPTDPMMRVLSIEDREDQIKTFQVDYFAVKANRG